MILSRLVNHIPIIPPGNSMTFSLAEFDLNSADWGLREIANSNLEFFYEVYPKEWKLVFYRLPAPYPIDGNIRTYVLLYERSTFSGDVGRWVRNGESTYYNQDAVAIPDRIYYSIEDVHKDFSFIRYVGDTIKHPTMRRQSEGVLNFCADGSNVDYDIYQLHKFQMRKSAYWFRFVAQ